MLGLESQCVGEFPAFLTNNSHPLKSIYHVSIDIDECELEASSACGPDAMCVNSEGSYQCIGQQFLYSNPAIKFIQQSKY